MHKPLALSSYTATSRLTVVVEACIGVSMLQEETSTPDGVQAMNGDAIDSSTSTCVSCATFALHTFLLSNT